MESLSLLHLQIFQVDWVCVSPLGWHPQNESSPYWRLYRNDDAGMQIESGGQTMEIEPGRVVLIPAEVRFSGQVKGAVGQFYIHFDVQGLPYRLRQEAFRRPQPLSAALEQQRGMDALKAAAARREMIHLDWAQECRAKALVYEALIRAWEETPESVRVTCMALTRAIEPLMPALRLIEATPQRKMCNAELARLCFMNEDYFIRRFREGMGVTPAQYIGERRIALAAQWLLLSNKTIETIALEAGFGGRSHFSQKFAAALGMTPGAYRRKKERPIGIQENRGYNTEPERKNNVG